MVNLRSILCHYGLLHNYSVSEVLIVVRNCLSRMPWIIWMCHLLRSQLLVVLSSGRLSHYAVADVHGLIFWLSSHTAGELIVNSLCHRWVLHLKLFLLILDMPHRLMVMHCISILIIVVHLTHLLFHVDKMGKCLIYMGILVLRLDQLIIFVCNLLWIQHQSER